MAYGLYVSTTYGRVSQIRINLGYSPSDERRPPAVARVPLTIGLLVPPPPKLSLSLSCAGNALRVGAMTIGGNAAASTA